MSLPSQPRRVALAALAAGSVALLSACGGSTQPADGGSGSGGSSSGTSTSIAFSPLGLQIPAMQGLAKGVQAYGKGKGFSVIVQDPSLNAQKQVTDLQSVIESGKVGGAWVIANQPSSLSALVKIAQQKKVALLLNGIPSDYGLSGLQPGITFDVIDYKALGTAMGEELGNCINEKLGGKAEVLEQLTAPGTAGKADIEAAQQAALKATAPGAEIVANVVLTDRATAQTDTGNALQGHPEIQAVFGGNDEGALGALGAFDAAGKKVTCLTENGGNDEVLADVKSGKIYASVALQFDGDMVQSFDTLAAMIKDPSQVGQQLTVPQKIIKAGS